MIVKHNIWLASECARTLSLNSLSLWTFGLQHSPSSAFQLHHPPQFLQARAGQWLCKGVCNVLFAGSIDEIEGAVLHMRVDEVIV
jgi:hypothetical protein